MNTCLHVLKETQWRVYLKFIEYFPDYLSALSRTLLRFFWTTFVETAVYIYIYFFSDLPRPVAYFPLNRVARGRDFRRRSPTARLRNVRTAPGPLGRPGGSIRLLGTATSYIQFPNRRGGALDTSYSMTILAWVYPEGSAGPLFNYHPSARGVHFWLRTRRTLYARFMRRKGRRYTTPVKSRQIQLRKWQFLGASYNRNTGTVALWRNGKKIAKRFIGRIRLATNYPVRMGAIFGDKRYFKGRVTCLQVYAVALNKAQVRRAAKKCFKSGTLRILPRLKTRGYQLC